MFESPFRTILDPIQGHCGSLTGFSLNHSQKIIATTSFDHTICLWDINSAELLETYNLAGCVPTVATWIDNDEKILVATSNGILWFVDRNKNCFNILADLRKQDIRGEILGLEYLPVTSEIIVVTKKAIVGVFDLKTSKITVIGEYSIPTESEDVKKFVYNSLTDQGALIFKHRLVILDFSNGTAIEYFHDTKNEIIDWCPSTIKQNHSFILTSREIMYWDSERAITKIQTIFPNIGDFFHSISLQKYDDQFEILSLLNCYGFLKTFIFDVKENNFKVYSKKQLTGYRQASHIAIEDKYCIFSYDDLSMTVISSENDSSWSFRIGRAMSFEPAIGWSPDGLNILKIESERSEILSWKRASNYSKSFVRSDINLLSHNLNHITHFDFSPDGSCFLFDDNLSQLYTYHIRSKQAENLRIDRSLRLFRILDAKFISDQQIGLVTRGIFYIWGLVDKDQPHLWVKMKEVSFLELERLYYPEQVIFKPDRQLIISIHGKTISVINIETGRVVKRIFHSINLKGIFTSSNDRSNVFVTIDEKNFINIWSFDTFEVLRSQKFPSACHGPMIPSPSGHYVIIFSGILSIVWEWQSNSITVLSNKQYLHQTVAWHPFHDTLVTYDIARRLDLYHFNQPISWRKDIWPEDFLF